MFADSFYTTKVGVKNEWAGLALLFETDNILKFSVVLSPLKQESAARHPIGLHFVLWSIYFENCTTCRPAAS